MSTPREAPTSSLRDTLTRHRDFFILSLLVLTFAYGLIHSNRSQTTQLQPQSQAPTFSCPSNSLLACIPSKPTEAPFFSSSTAHPFTTNRLTMSESSWFQKTLTLPAKKRGSYLITSDVVNQLPELKSYKVGILHLFIQHTSCALSLNENWDSDVREDMSDALDRLAPEDRKGELYRHSAEGLDDMPAHIKSALIGTSVTVPISNGKLATGTWQGIWYLEFRASKHTRKVVATIQGERE